MMIDILPHLEKLEIGTEFTRTPGEFKFKPRFAAHIDDPLLGLEQPTTKIVHFFLLTYKDGRKCKVQILDIRDDSI